MDAQEVLKNIEAVSTDFAKDALERQRRRHLDPADFQRLHDAGYMLTGLPASEGGLFEDVTKSTAPICEILNTLAKGDPSVALVSAMHPAVLVFWLLKDEVPEPHAAAWREQRREVFDAVKAGASFGTITSEPGTGGDVLKTKTAAIPDGGGNAYRITGDKHFGSGSGQHAFMTTVALPEGEDLPDFFFLDMRDVPWDGSTGATMVAEWDGHGMAATQSHGFRFENFPATRIAWQGHIAEIAPLGGSFANYLFTAVIVGVVESAMTAARKSLAPRFGHFRAYEQVEWARAENEFWLIQQAYRGMLRDSASLETFVPSSLRGKTVIAETSEALLNRICKVVGGATFSRHAPFSGWAQDVRALGFLRPPWPLAYDQLHNLAQPNL